MSSFYQAGPELANQYRDDRVLRDFLAWRMPADVLARITPGLDRLGARVADDVLALARQAEAAPPRLVRYDPWGRRIDQVEISPAWQELHRVAAEEGIVATAYERGEREYSRLHQFARLYLFHPSSALYSCPLAMTDGAARVLELEPHSEIAAELLGHLTSRNGDQFWTAGQWMTERSGGSDVSGTTTEARWEDDGFRLYGDKWFTSAVTADIALALARVPGEQRLSLFCLRTRTAAGELDQIRIHRLKDKLGTRAMPTAELSLEGTRAVLIGERGHGVRTVATMLNITRLYNAVCAVACMRRGLALARDYAQRRSAFGRRLIEHPLHAETLAALELEFEAALVLVFQLGLLLGREETGTADERERGLLRLLTPVAKLYTGKRAVAVTSEVLEAFGGAGYIEDTGLPALLRDAQVLPIWEGTTNVLSLDVLRVIRHDSGLDPFIVDVGERLQRLRHPGLADAAASVGRALATLTRTAQEFGSRPREHLEVIARRFAFALARVYTASLLLERADWSLARGGGAASLAIARRFCDRSLAIIPEIDAGYLSDSKNLAGRLQD